MDGEFASAPLQPKALHEHEKATDMVEVQMRQEYAVDGIVVDAGLVKATAHRFAAIDEQPGLAEAVKVGGMIALGRPAVTDSETRERGILHSDPRALGARASDR